jgi:hypothetical protein
MYLCTVAEHRRNVATITVHIDSISDPYRLSNIRPKICLNTYIQYTVSQAHSTPPVLMQQFFMTFQGK